MAHILLIDDDRDLLELTAEFLRTEGHQIDTAIDGTSAVRALSENRYDLVISDVVVPHFNGMQLAQLAKSGEYGNPKVMLITGVTRGSDFGDEVVREGIGVDAYLSKPIYADALRARVRAVLDLPPTGPI